MVRWHNRRRQNSLIYYIRLRTSNSTAKDRLQQQRTTSSSIMEFINRVLDSIFGSLQLSWEGSYRNKQIMAMLGHSSGSVCNRVRGGLSSTGKQVADLFSYMALPGLSNTIFLGPLNLTASSDIPSKSQRVLTSLSNITTPQPAQQQGQLSGRQQQLVTFSLSYLRICNTAKNLQLSKGDRTRMAGVFFVSCARLSFAKSNKQKRNALFALVYMYLHARD